MTRKQLFTLLATIVGSGIVVLDGTVVNLALPHIASDLHASFADLQWIVDGYMLSLSALILLGGSLGDVFGRKRTYLFGLVGFGVLSLLCGLAPDRNVLISLRVLQGIFGALLVPGALAIINTNFEKQERGKAIGRWAAWLSLGPALGPLLGGYIVGATSWRWIFFINIPLVMVCLVFGLIGIKETKDEWQRRLDIRGALLTVLGLGGLTFGLIEGPVRHWDIPVLVSLFVGVVSLVLFVRTERRQKDPMVPLKLFRSRNFTGANLMTFAQYGALSGFIFGLVIYLQTKMHYAPIAAGASLLPVSTLLFALSGRIGGLVSKFGPRLFMTVGPLLCAMGMGWLFWLHPGVSYWVGVFPGAVLFGLGMALLVAPLTITVMASVADTDSGIASGINNAVSRAAGLIVVALLGLFGAAHAYRFTVVLCAGLAAFAGVISFVVIRNAPVVRAARK